MLNEIMNVDQDTNVGYILAPQDPDADGNLLLGAADWERHFQKIAIKDADWRAFLKDGLDEALREIAIEGLVGEAEEAWFEPNALVNVCKELAAGASPRSQRLLRDIAELARDAFARGVPVILSM